MLTIGQPQSEKNARNSAMRRNCWSRSGCWLQATDLRLTRSEKPQRLMRSATLVVLIRYPLRCSSAATLAPERRVHLRPLTGSPAVSGSSSRRRSAISAGFFFGNY